MTRPGAQEISPEARAMIARLMQIHRATHPMILARKLNFTPRYVRKLWEQIEHQDVQLAMRWLEAAFAGDALLTVTLLQAGERLANKSNKSNIPNKEHSGRRAVPNSPANGKADITRAQEPAKV